jgi:hypothetical protein
MRIEEVLTPDAAEERVAALEKRVRDMDALVKGLMAELLDLKTATMAITRQARERTIPGPVLETVVAAPSESPSIAVSSGGTTVIRPKGASLQDAPAAPAEPAMARIMQADGTMKMEPRYGDKRTVDTSSGSGRMPKNRPVGNKKDS